MATKLAELLKKLSIKPKDWSSDSTDIVKWAPEAEINNPEVAIVIATYFFLFFKLNIKLLFSIFETENIFLTKYLLSSIGDNF